MKKLVLMISCFLSFGVQSAEVKEEEKKPLNYFFSHDAKAYHGYTVAKKKDGECFIYTAALSDTLSKNYQWSDKKLIGKYSPSDLEVEPKINECKNVKDLFGRS
jgi:hypothetical protein